jgi:hypothetical protein
MFEVGKSRDVGERARLSMCRICKPDTDPARVDRGHLGVA